MKKIGLVILSFFLLHASYSQSDTLIKKLDSLSKKTDSAGGQIDNTDPKAYNESTQINFNTFFVLQWSNLKQAFTKPFHMSKQDWIKFGKFAVITGALALADESIQKAALDLRDHNEGVRVIGKQVTNFGGTYEAYTLAALGAYAFIFREEKMQTTTLLALQSYITGASVENVLKFIRGRQRPFAYNPKQNQPEPTFLGPFKNMYDA